MQKLFLDANVIIDFLDDSRKNHSFAQELFRHCFLNGIEMGTSEDLLTTVYYVCKKNIPEEKILDFFSFFQSECVFEIFGDEVLSEAIEYCQAHKNSDLEDVLQAVCARKNGYDGLISNDKQFVSDIIEVVRIEDVLGG